MKKLALLFLFALAAGAIFQACSDTKTYAEMLADERKAIDKFKTKHGIKVISVEEFEKDTTTNVAENEYVYFTNGVYMQIIDRGVGDTVKVGDEILLRMAEYCIMAEIDDDISADTISNVEVDWMVDSFIYNPNSTSTLYYDMSGYFPLIYYQYYGSSGVKVPDGMMAIMPYIRSGARVKLIIPSKMGHETSLQYVYPYYYDIRKIQIW